MSTETSKTKVTNETRRADAEKRREANRKAAKKEPQVASTTVAPDDADTLEPKTEGRVAEVEAETEKPKTTTKK